jgi:hypothetical protein
VFLTKHVPALFKKATLKLLPTDDGLRRICESTLVVEPFFPNLARELGDDIADHLFDDDDQIRPELEAIDLSVRCGLQRVVVTAHQDLDPVADLAACAIRTVQVKRMGDEKTGRYWLALTFVLVVTLDSQEARTFVIDGFGRELLWTFTAMQRELLNEAKLHDSIANMLPKGEGGTLTISSGGKSATLTQEGAAEHRATAKKLRQQAGVTS